MAVNSPHPIFEKFRPFEGVVQPGFTVDFAGVLIDERFFAPRGPFTYENPTFVRTGRPPCTGDGYFDLIAVFEAIDRACGQFVMMELGAGYGYWLSQGAAGARQRGLPTQLIGVEAEPDHFRMMVQHLRNNGIPAAQHRLLHAAVAPTDGEVYFATGQPHTWWGQMIVSGRRHRTPGIKREKIVRIPAISLNTLLKDLAHVNVLHMDVQGVELAVLSSGFAQVTSKVMTAIVGTHSAEIEAGLRSLFGGAGWRPVYDFARDRVNATPFGDVPFEDRLQVWENPRLLRSER